MAQQAEELGATFTLRASAWTVVPATAMSIIGLLAVAYVEFALTRFSVIQPHLVGTLRVVAALLILILILVWTVPAVVHWRITTLTLDDDRVVVTRGLVVHSVNSIPLERVNEVCVMQRLLGRMVGVGDVVLEVAPPGPSEVFFGVRRPLELQAALSAASDRFHSHRRPGSGWGGAGSAWGGAPEVGDAFIDQLERLEALRDRGALSDEEFVAAKQRLFLKP